MASRRPPPSKWGQREDNDDKIRCRKKLEKGKELAAKDADEEPLFSDTKFAVELLRSAFRKLEGVGVAFDIKAHHDVYKDPSVKALLEINPLPTPVYGCNMAVLVASGISCIEVRWSTNGCNWNGAIA
jgi:hypothetical protein